MLLAYLAFLFMFSQIKKVWFRSGSFLRPVKCHVVILEHVQEPSVPSFQVGFAVLLTNRGLVTQFLLIVFELYL